MHPRMVAKLRGRLAVIRWALRVFPDWYPGVMEMRAALAAADSYEAERDEHRRDALRVQAAFVAAYRRSTANAETR